MTEAESIEFLNDVAFVAFPSVRDWLVQTKTPNESVKMMVRALSDISRDEADAVIDSWITGRIAAPKYLRDGFVLHIRACAMERRHQRWEAEEAQRKRQEERQTYAERSVMQSIQTMEIWTEHWMPMQAAVRSGELDQSSALRQWYAIVGIDPERV
jgi:hypothetical protein